MAKKKKREWEFPDPKRIEGVMWTTPMPTELRLFYGLGSLFLGAAAMSLAPKAANKLLPVLLSAWTPPPGFQALPFQPAKHPEALEPIVTKIDERQLGRSEVIREIANPKKN